MGALPCRILLWPTSGLVRAFAELYRDPRISPFSQKSAGPDPLASTGSS
jgi:hypothetical protein